MPSKSTPIGDVTTDKPIQEVQGKRLPEGWKETTLGEFITLQRGFDLPTKERTHGIFPLMVSNGQDGTHDEYKVTGPGIVTGRSGTLGEVFFVNENFWPLNTTLWVSDFHGNDPRFAYYFLKKFPLLKYNAGSGVPTLNRNHVHPLPVIIPPLPIQKRISVILGCLDDKIDLLRRQNKTLEATAQLLFKRWFVEFNFPNEERKPYRESGGKMVESELGVVPEGWGIGSFDDCVNICGGSTPSTTNPEFWNGAIHWTSPKDLSNSKENFLLSTEKKITDAGLNQVSSGLLPKGTLLLSSRAPVGYVAITNIDLAINQGYIAFVSGGKFSNYFMYLWLKQNMEVVINAANGSTFLEISKSSFRNIECVVPNNKALNAFDSLIKSFFDKQLSNLLQIQILSNLRDSLLPKLVSGKLLTS